jgi:hypothetical protein
MEATQLPVNELQGVISQSIDILIHIIFVRVYGFILKAGRNVNWNITVSSPSVPKYELPW